MLRIPDKGDRPRIVVLGAGFGGLAFCHAFRGDAQVVLIDSQNHHLFQPLLYQVAMAGLSAGDIAAPVRSICRRRRNVHVHMAEATGIDLQQQHVQCDDGRIDYDYVVLAVGARTSYFGHAEWEQHALGLKTLDDALAIRRKILTSFEQAENTADAAEARRLTTIVVVGGGPTGVELAGAMAELTRHVFKRDFRRIDTSQARVVLVEGGDRVLDAYPPELSRSAAAQLEQLGVELRLDTYVTGVTAGKVELTRGDPIETRNILWSAGIQAHPVTRALRVPLDRAGRIRVDRDLSIPGRDNAFAIGDVAAVFNDDGSPVPGVAPAAMQMGRHVAKRITRELKGFRTADLYRRPFRYRNKGSMATIGRSRAVAWLGRLRFGGFAAWAAWLTIHLLFLVTFRNKLMVFLNWIYAYFSYGRGARIIFGRDRDDGGPASEGPP